MRKNLSPKAFDLTASLFHSPAIQQAIRDFLAPAPKLKILDVACGTGTLSGLALPAQVFGLDMEFGRVRQAAQYHPYACFAVGDAMRLPWPDRTFDRILSAGLFHHVDEATAGAILSELTRILAPRGWVVCFDAIWPTRVWNVAGWLARRFDRGAYVRTAEESCRILGRYFQVVESKVPSRLGLEYMLVKLIPEVG